MLMEEVKTGITKVLQNPIIRDILEERGLGPAFVIDGFLENLERICRRDKPHKVSEIKLHVQNIQENREEAEQFVADFSEFM